MFCNHPGVEVGPILAQPAQRRGAGSADRSKILYIIFGVIQGFPRSPCLPLAGLVGAVGLLRRRAHKVVNTTRLLHLQDPRREFFLMLRVSRKPRSGRSSFVGQGSDTPRREP
jgi:hypothetical protein